jgi:hypothetical protein
MATPVVVQGTAVGAPYPTQSNVGYGGPVEVSGPGATQEPPKTGCKDPIFALLFYMNVGAIAAVAVIYGLDAIAGENASTYLPYVRSTSSFERVQMYRFTLVNRKRRQHNLTLPSFLFV